jgi:hypothetical protein
LGFVVTDSQKFAEAFQMAALANLIYALGCQAMGESHVGHEVAKEDAKHLLIRLAVFCCEDSLDLSRLDVILEVNFELFQPKVEVFGTPFDLDFYHQGGYQSLVRGDFQYVFEEDAEQVGCNITILLLGHGRFSVFLGQGFLGLAIFQHGFFHHFCLFLQDNGFHGLRSVMKVLLAVLEVLGHVDGRTYKVVGRSRIVFSERKHHTIKVGIEHRGMEEGVGVVFGLYVGLHHLFKLVLLEN